MLCFRATDAVRTQPNYTAGNTAALVILSVTGTDRPIRASIILTSLPPRRRGAAATCSTVTNLVTGKSGLILDVVVEAGNPADAERFLPMLDRQIPRCGVPPRQMAADGGYASLDNLQQAKARGVQDVAFHKKRGIAVEDMVKSRWVYRRLGNFRAGIEAGISCLKRGYGLARCTWRGLDHFRTYIWSAVVAHNLVLFARLKPA